MRIAKRIKLKEIHRNQESDSHPFGTQSLPSTLSAAPAEKLFPASLSPPFTMCPQEKENQKQQKQQ